jgi:hypothetical protein
MQGECRNPYAARNAAFVFSLAIAVFAVVAAVPSATTDTHASASERPTVELVKVFDCNLRTKTAPQCAMQIENEANAWLQSLHN